MQLLSDDEVFGTAPAQSQPLLSDDEVFGPAGAGVEDGVLSAVGKGAQNVIPGWKGQAGGLVRAAGEALNDSDLVRGPEFMRALRETDPGTSWQERAQAAENIAGQQAATDPGWLRQQGQGIADAGAAIADRAADQRVPINTEQGSAAYYAGAATESIGNMVPALAAGIATRNPGTAAAIIAPQVYGSAYQSAREDGANSETSRNYAMASMAAEAIPEKLALDAIFKGGKSLAGRIGVGMAAEGAQEMLTEAINIGLDMGILNHGMTWGEAWQRIKDGGIIGAISGGVIGGGVHTADTLLGRRREPEEDQAPPAPSDEPLLSDAEVFGEAPAEASEVNWAPTPSDPPVAGDPGAIDQAALLQDAEAATATPADWSVIEQQAAALDEADPTLSGVEPIDVTRPAGDPANQPQEAAPAAAPALAPVEAIATAPVEASVASAPADATATPPLATEIPVVAENQSVAPPIEQPALTAASETPATPKLLTRAEKMRRIAPGDDILTAIAKAGGLSRAEAEAQRIDPAAFRQRRGILPIFSKSGRSFDDLAQALAEHGYFAGEDYTANGLLDRVDRALRGEFVGTPDGLAAKAERDLREAEIERAIRAEDAAALDAALPAEAFDEIALPAEPFAELPAPERSLSFEVGHAMASGVTPAEIEAAIGTGDVDLAEARAALRQLTEEKNRASQRDDSDAGDQQSAEAAAGAGREDPAGALDDIPGLERFKADDPRTDEEIDRLFGLAPEQTLLSAYTEADVAAREQAQADAARAEADRRRQQEQRASADAERDDFRLSGSDRPADVAAAGGQADLLAAANEAATSPLNDLPEPTQAQKEAGNYKVGRIRVAGLEISIENPKGSTRSGTSPDGTVWQNTMGAHYGYIRRTEGADGDHVDVFVGDNPESERVWVIDQVNADGSFDEHKALLGFSSRSRAIGAYKASYTRGWKVGPVTEMTVDQFKEWLQGDTTRPLAAAAAPADKPARPVRKKGKEETKARGRARQIIGAEEGDIITPSAGVGFAGAGEAYRIEKIDRRGTVYLQSVSGGSRTQWSPGELAGAQRGGVTFAKQEASREGAAGRSSGESGVLFSLADNAEAAAPGDSAVSKVEAHEVVERISGAWRRRGNIDVVDGYADLPAVIRIAAQMQKATPEQVKGAFYQGRLYIVRENHRTAASLERTIFHEAYGHYGIRGLFGQSLYQKLNQLYLAIGGSKGLNALATRHGIALTEYRRTPDIPLEVRRVMLLEELLAHIAEDQRPSIARRALEIFGAIRQWLREHGFMRLAKLSNSDIMHLLRQARQYVQKGEDVSIVSGEPVLSTEEVPFSLSPSVTETEAFKRWFGDSKVVDESGKPLVVYHGTNADVATFDATETVDGGFHFGTAGQASMRVAGQGKNLMPVYLSAKNLRRSKDAGGNWKTKIASAKSDGYDGIVYLNRYEGISLETIERAEVEGVNLDRISDADFRAFAPEAADSYIVFRSEQVKSATGNTGTFDPNNADIRFSLRDDDPGLDQALSKLGLSAPEKRTLGSVIRDKLSHDYRAILKRLGQSVYEGAIDGLAGIQRAETAAGKGIVAKDYAGSGYVSARLATGTADVMTAVLQYGAPEWRDGVLRHRAGTKGLLDILGQLEKTELRDWLGWMAGNRANELMQQGRERNLTQAEIDALVALNKGRESRFEQVRQDYLALNKAMLDMAEEAGLIEAGERASWASDWYVPFYRQSEGEPATLMGPRTRRGLSHQSSGIRKLKGGELPTADLLTNVITNWMQLTDSAMKNMALLKTVDNLKDTDFLANESFRWKKVVVPRSQIVQRIKVDRESQLYWARTLGLEDTATALETAQELVSLDNKGFEQLWRMEAPTDPDVIRVMRNGKPEFYRIYDQPLLRALTAVSFDGFNEPFMRAGRWFKRLLTTGVTTSPDFIARNLIRDAVHAWAINPDGFKLGRDTVSGAWQAFQEDPAYRDLMFAGASFQGGYVHGTDPQASAQLIRRTLERKGYSESQIKGHLGTVIDSGAKAKGMLEKSWQAYRGVGDKIENSSRISVYNAARRAGKSPAQAAFEAKDLMDYSRRGNAAAAIRLTDLVPFLNARIQGLDRLARTAGMGKAMTLILAKHMAYIGIASTLLAMLNGDDERYQSLPDWDKDAYWHVFVGEHHWRIPKPFEIGFLAATMPERMYHAWVADTQPDEKVRWAFMHGLFGTLGFNPVPQAIMPIAEVVANRSFFFDTPIESETDENRLPVDRASAYTSDTAKLLSMGMGDIANELGLSPKVIEHLWTGYTGTMGAYALEVADVAVRAATNAPPRPAWGIESAPLVKAFYRGTEPPRSTQYMTDFYDRLNEVRQLHGSLRSAQTDARIDELLAGGGQEQLGYRPALEGAARAMSQLRKSRDAVMLDPDMAPGEKRLRLNELNRQMNALAKNLSEATEAAF